MSVHGAVVLFLLSFSLLAYSAFENLLIAKLERRIDLTSHIVRVHSTVKIKNAGPEKASSFMLAYPDVQARHLSYISASVSGGKGKIKGPALNVTPTDNLPGASENITFLSVSLPNDLGEEETLTVDVLEVYTHLLEPFPQEIAQGDIQLVLFRDSASYLSPYGVAAQSLSLRLPSPRVESYTMLPNTKLVDLELKYGPYEDAPSFSYKPIIVHFENTRPFAFANLLVRELEISPWGSIRVTESYEFVHGGALLKGGFSRFVYQTSPTIRSTSSLRHLIARLPPRASSVYYRDEIGNISSSHLWHDFRKTLLEVEPRYPLFGGWKTSFTIGYNLPLQDFLFKAEGKHFLDFPFGCFMDEVVVDNLVVKVLLPEGSKELSAQVPFPTSQWQEVKYTHLDIVGRPVIVLQKNNAVPEHNVHFQVYYKFNKLHMLRKPVTLIIGLLLFFLACILYMHFDLSLSKRSPSYLGKLHWEEVQATVNKVHAIISCCLAGHDKLEASLRELSRTGDIHACKAVRRAVEAVFKEKAKEQRPLVSFLQSSQQAAFVSQKVDDLISKEKQMQEKAVQKHTTMVECYEKKSSSREIESRVDPFQQKIMALRQVVECLLDEIDDAI